VKLVRQSVKRVVGGDANQVVTIDKVGVPYRLRSVLFNAVCGPAVAPWVPLVTVLDGDGDIAWRGAVYDSTVSNNFDYVACFSPSVSPPIVPVTLTGSRILVTGSLPPDLWILDSDDLQLEIDGAVAGGSGSDFWTNIVLVRELLV